MSIIFTAIGLLVKVLVLPLISLISHHELEDTYLYKCLYTGVRELFLTLKATEIPTMDKFYLHMIFHVYVMRVMPSWISLHNRLDCWRVVDQFPFPLTVIRLIKINSSVKSSEIGGVAWSNVTPHTSDTGTLQTQHEDVCMKYTSHSLPRVEHHTAVIVSFTNRVVSTRKTDWGY